MKSRKYYTPAEFAKLFRIDRQTLIYYDNHGIFSPSFKNENGYRYYGLDQVFRFAELLALRKLAIPGCRLSEFSAAPSRDLLKEIPEDKIMEYEEELQRITRSIKDMKSTIHSMEQENILPMEQIMLIPHGTLYCQRSIVFHGHTSHCEAFLQSAPLVSFYARSLFSGALQFSFLPDFQDLEDLASPHDYRLVLLSRDPHIFQNPLSYGPSLYLTMLLEKPFHRNERYYLRRIRTFMEQLHLKSKNTLFITLQRTAATDSGDPVFHTKLELQVEYEKGD
ncbi:MerR family DNA-binding transcriptional regulator [uncultured Dialister sp.]|uniref:MerR family DNA-binding transcriptional regulator n=1 Tax=uncultured Dialister sp. TaxID=278064 RepID=UPI0026DC9AEB|nr:MerR family DNA-binding transcriptional regulator [uncultured Dialister sp.]